MPKRQVDWKRGSASLIIIMCMSLLACFLLVLYMTMLNVTYANSIAMTRTDAIADSAAVYAQSYDYDYNKTQAEIMVNLLTTYNNATSDFYKISAAVSFPDDRTLTVKSVVTTPTFYPDMLGDDQLYSLQETTVKSVDIFGDVLQVPSDIATAPDGWRDPATRPPVDEDAADGVVG